MSVARGRWSHHHAPPKDTGYRILSGLDSQLLWLPVVKKGLPVPFLVQLDGVQLQFVQCRSKSKFSDEELNDMKKSTPSSKVPTGMKKVWGKA